MGFRLIWYLFPVLVIFACRFIIVSVPFFARHHIKSVDIATFFLVIGLSELSQDTYGNSIVPFWLIATMIIGIGIAIFFAAYYGELNYARFFKVFWRITFLMTITLYLVLIICNLTMNW